MIAVIKHYPSFNPRRYRDPWVAIVDADGKPDFSIRCGGYTGMLGKGDEGDLYVTDPTEGAIYMHGQKDTRGSNTELSYAQYISGEMVEVTKSAVIYFLDRMRSTLRLDDGNSSTVKDAEAKTEPEEQPEAPDTGSTEAVVSSDSDLTIKSISALSGRSMLAISKELGINYRTILRWSTGESEAPQYVLRLIAEHYGLIKIDSETE